ncbi:MAG: glycosyltransferase [Verrucomicrobiae bacterium]
MTSISVIIPTKGRGTTIVGALQSIGNQSVPVEEVVIVDGTPLAAEAGLFKECFSKCAQAPRIRYCHAPEDSGLTAGRNRGIRESTGEIIQFLDDDAVLAPDYFEHLLETFKSPEVGGASGVVIEPERPQSTMKRIFFRFFYIGPFRQIREEAFLYPSREIVRTNTLPGVGAYRRQVFAEEMFDENLTGACIGEDIDFSYRVGQRSALFIQPLSKVYHYPSPAERQTVRRNYCDKVCFYHYHFKKNLAALPGARLTYLWLNFGFAIHALFRFQAGAVLGVCDGWRKNLQKPLEGRL